MLHVCQPKNINRLFTAQTRSLTCHISLVKLGWTTTTGRCLAPLRKHRRKMFFPRNNDPLPSSGTKPKVDNYAVGKFNIFNCSGKTFETPTFRQYKLSVISHGLSQKTKK